jgi:hypothetical protein|tara:strand:+ start:586 stop:897 length:312 start_codon:yes stop_codon:yes gene_type:complete
MSADVKWRSLTEEESLTILKEHLENEDIRILGFNNHRKVPKIAENTFRFTINVISFDFIINLMEDEAVKNIYFHPSAPPPGKGLDGISMRYRVYVEYHEVEDV